MNEIHVIYNIVKSMLFYLHYSSMLDMGPIIYIIVIYFYLIFVTFLCFCGISMAVTILLFIYFFDLLLDISIFISCLL